MMDTPLPLTYATHDTRPYSSAYADHGLFLFFTLPNWPVFWSKIKLTCSNPISLLLHLWSILVRSIRHIQYLHPVGLLCLPPWVKIGAVVPKGGCAHTKPLISLIHSLPPEEGDEGISASLVRFDACFV